MPDAPPGVVIRRAGPDDWPAVARIHALSWRSAYRGIYPDDFLEGEVFDERCEYWRRTLARFDPEEDAVFLAEEEGRAVGFACLMRKADPAGPLLDNLHVLPDLKGRGIGRRLIAAAAHWLARKEPEAALQLGVWSANRQARRFYARLGGIEVDESEVPTPGGGTAPQVRVQWARPAALAALGPRLGAPPVLRLDPPCSPS